MNGPANTNFISPSVMRYISLQGADKGEKISLAYDGSKLIGQKITGDSSINDKWRMIQVKTGVTNFFFMYHCETGLFLSVDKNRNLLLIQPEKIQKIDDNNQPISGEYNSFWQQRGNERGIYLLSPDIVRPNFTDNTKGDYKDYMSYCQGTGLMKDGKPWSRKGAGLPSNWFSAIYPGDPIGGNVYILLGNKNNDGNYSINLGPPNADSIKDMTCVAVVKEGDKSHAWYLLPQLHVSNEVFNVPVRTGMSLGEFFSWDPSKEVNSSYNISREKISKRFIESKTQIVPQQSIYPQICAITQDPNAVDCIAQTTSDEMFNRTTTLNWEYIDIYAYFGGDQGYAPAEFKKLSVENMGLGGNLSSMGPGPLSSDYGPNTENLFNYIDGKKAGGQGGRITIPPKWMVDACHKNGVKCYGSIFFQEIYYGGKWAWWVQFCQDPNLSAKLMAEICNFYGFDGWLFNLETGPPDSNLPSDYSGQDYSGISQLSGDKIDSYWCNVMAASKYPTWWVNQGQGPFQDNECGSPENWPCSCTVKVQDSGDICGSLENRYTKGCNNGLTLRSNFKKMILSFNNYRKKNGINAELFLYDTIQVTSPYGVGISTVDPTTCPDGINNTSKTPFACKGQDNCYGNFDLWQDTNGPVADYIFSMRSGCGGSEPSASPQGVTSTAILSQSKENFTWPVNTGPDVEGTFCPSNSDLFSGAKCGFGKPVIGGISENRAYDYYQALQLEGLGGNKYDLESAAQNLSLMSAKGNPQGWDSAIYCGTQSKNLASLGYGAASGNCINEEAAIEKPLSSLNFYYIDTVWRWFNSYSNIEGYPERQAITNWVIQNQLVFWTGARFLTNENRINKGTAATYWKGISHYVTERSCINSYPFYTSFSIGAGKDFYIKGSRQNFGEWNNWSLQSILPTWMWCPENLNDAKYIQIYFDINEVYQGSNSLCFTTTTDPSSWIRSNPELKCDYTSPRTDCGFGDKEQCLSAGCCFDDNKPDDKPWCFNKKENYSDINTKSSAYRLYKTNLSLSSGCMVSLIYKMIGKGELSLGYSTLNSNTIVWKNIPINNNWNEFRFTIPSQENSLSIIWVWVRLSYDTMSKIFLGELAISDKIYNPPSTVQVKIKQSFTTTKTNKTSYILEWNPDMNAVYYNIFNDDKLIGHYYQGRNVRDSVKSLPVKYWTVGTSNNFKITPEAEYGSIIKEEKSELKTIILILGIILIVCIVGFILIYKNKVSQKVINILIGVIILIVILVIITNYILLKDKTRTIKNNINYKVEMWQDCRSHSFNACFDDSRVKCWKWLVYMHKKKNWPFKFSFFYNTLWITRDYYQLKEWMDLGHEITCHMHTHICACATKQYDWGTQSWRNLSDKEVADNLILCARLIRKLYNDPNKELMMAWPHGAFPLVNPNIPCGDDQAGQDCNANDGTPRPDVNEALENNFIGGRSTMVNFNNTWPNPAMIKDSKNRYKWNLWNYSISPIWAWPYQIDINPPTLDDPDLCEGYFKDLDKALSVPYGSVIIAGHTFAPTDSEGNDVPCDWTDASQLKDGPYEGSWCKDPNDCQSTFVCPKEIRDITEGCYTNAVNTPLPLYTNGVLSDPVFPPNKDLELQTPTGTPSDPNNPHGTGVAECNQCCDACWDPVPGSCLIKLFDNIAQNSDLYWFATYTEILQYTYNRQNSSLEFIKKDKDEYTFNLNCGKMYNCDLSISFSSSKFSAFVDGKKVKTYLSNSEQFYIKFIPKSNTKHVLKIVF
jgi:endo-beta-N-acetylglucosaminidase D